jgi:hypothetical protein
LVSHKLLLLLLIATSFAFESLSGGRNEKKLSRIAVLPEATIDADLRCSRQGDARREVSCACSRETLQ